MLAEAAIVPGTSMRAVDRPLSSRRDMKVQVQRPQLSGPEPPTWVYNQRDTLDLVEKLLSVNLEVVTHHWLSTSSVPPI